MELRHLRYFAAVVEAGGISKAAARLSITQPALSRQLRDLEVELVDTKGGEVGYLTEVFRDMVSRLKTSRDELERLSVTDPLTGLDNRRRMTEATWM